MTACEACTPSTTATSLPNFNTSIKGHYLTTHMHFSGHLQLLQFIFVLHSTKNDGTRGREHYCLKITARPHINTRDTQGHDTQDCLTILSATCHVHELKRRCAFLDVSTHQLQLQPSLKKSHPHACYARPTSRLVVHPLALFPLLFITKSTKRRPETSAQALCSKSPTHLQLLPSSCQACSPS